MNIELLQKLKHENDSLRNGAKKKTYRLRHLKKICVSCKVDWERQKKIYQYIFIIRKLMKQNLRMRSSS